MNYSLRAGKENQYLELFTCPFNKLFDFQIQNDLNNLVREDTNQYGANNSGAGGSRTRVQTYSP